ncbi:hypothetical protein HifGL_000313 [Haemophilus influenzae KR494]|nr:hypothetical protein HifGL_000313 [Haemophilus influenzae KR494]
MGVSPRVYLTMKSAVDFDHIFSLFSKERFRRKIKTQS